MWKQISTNPLVWANLLAALIAIMCAALKLDAPKELSASGVGVTALANIIIALFQSAQKNALIKYSSEAKELVAKQQEALTYYIRKDYANYQLFATQKPKNEEDKNEISR